MQDDDPSPMGPATVSGIRDLQKKLHMIQWAVVEGKLGALRADLPDHYVATDADLKKMPIKKLSTAYKARYMTHMTFTANI